jgi:hypothetical protein
MSQEIRRDPADWEPLAAGACFVVALFSLAFGFVFTTRWLLDAQLHPFLHSIGLGLLIGALPVVILGAHFMDRREKKLTARHIY